MEEKRVNKLNNTLVRGRQEFDLSQKRIFLQVINELNPRLEVSEDLFTGNKVIRIHDARKIVGGIKYSSFKKSMLDLQQKRIMLIDDDKKEAFDSILPFPKVSYSDGTLEITIFEDALPSLYNLKEGFTQYELQSAMSLSTINSQRLYELLSGWKDVDSKKYEFDLLKIHMNLDNKKTYEKFGKFNRDVLKPCQLEINDKTDISFNYETIKRGRNVYAMRFFVNKKRTIPLSETKDNTDKEARLLVKLNEYGITRHDYRQRILSDQDGFWEANHQLQMSKSTIKSPSGFILKRLGIV